MTSPDKSLEQCTLPELAQRVVTDRRRQAFNSIWNDEAMGIVNDAVQVLRAHVDAGADLDQADANGQTALDILVDPQHYISTEPKVVLALLQGGARTSANVLDYITARLYAENTFDTALMFHARAHSAKPLREAGMGNYYHALIDTDNSGFVLIAPMLDMKIKHNTGISIDEKDIALLAGWTFEAREFDGNTPVMLAWDKLDGKQFSGPDDAQHFEDFSLPDLWKLTARYLAHGGDLTQQNHQGRSILSNIFKHDPNLDSKAWADGKIDGTLAGELRAHLAALHMEQDTQKASFKGSRPRM
jgi:hypothetical protein